MHRELSVFVKMWPAIYPRCGLSQQMDRGCRYDQLDLCIGCLHIELQIRCLSGQGEMK